MEEDREGAVAGAVDVLILAREEGDCEEGLDGVEGV